MAVPEAATEADSARVLLPTQDASGILVTRPAAEASATATRLRARGYAPVLAPLLDIVRLPARLPPPAALQAILVTSPRALGALGPEYHGVPLLAVGDASAAWARRAGHVDVRSAAGDAADLLALAQARCHPQGGAVLLLSGAGEGAGLAAALAQSFRVAQRFAYAALPAALLPAPATAALRAGRLAAALFFSAATARAFATLAEAACLRDTVTGVEALAISAETAIALAALPWRDVRVALRPNQNELLDLLR